MLYEVRAVADDAPPQETLAERLPPRAPLRRVAQVVPLLASFADALATAHDAGLAHGALDARSVLLCPGGGVVLRGVTPRDEEARRADVRAFGALSFQLLTGEPPTARLTDPAALRPEVPHRLADLIRDALRATVTAAAIACRCRRQV
jgi:hypothetical protein